MRPARLDLGLAVLAALLVAFYVWTAATSASLRPADRLVDDYNVQTDALLAGQTQLKIKPDPGLLSLPDPYDPALNQPFRFALGNLTDVSLYEGRFYTYWGLTPIPVAFAPFRALGLGDLPPSVAALAFCIATLLVSLALLRALVRRFAPDAPGWMVLAAGALVGVANVAPWLLRRPSVYEVAIAAGQCFLLAGLLLLLTGSSRRRLAAASLCLGLAAGARPHLALGAVALAAVAWPRRRDRRRDRDRTLLALFGPFAACLAVIGAYNVDRFGSPLEFGQRFQIAGFDYFHDGYLSLSYLVPNLWYYVVSPAAWRLQFPFFWLGPPPNFPGHAPPPPYAQYDPTGGVLPNLPILALLVVAPFVLRAVAPRRLVAGSVAVGLALMFFIALWVPSTAQRYEADFTTLLLVPALLVWLVAWRRRAIRVAGVVLGAYGAIVAVALSMTGSANAMRAYKPRMYASLTSFFDPLPTLASRVAGRPLIAAIGDDPRFEPQRVDRVDLGGVRFETGTTVRTMQVYAPRDGAATLSATVNPLLAKLLPRTRYSVRVGRATAPTTGRRQRVRIALHRGRNDFPVGVVARPTLPLGDDDPARGSVVELTDVEVR